MSTVTHTATIHASKASTWNVLKDFGAVHRWHFNVEASPIVGSIQEGLGARRLNRFYDGTELTEEIIEYEDGAFMNIAFVEHAMPLQRANVVFRVHERSAQETEVTITMDYAMRYGPVGWVLDRAILRPTMRKVFRRMLEGLNHHTRTGEWIGKDGEVVPTE